MATNPTSIGRYVIVKRLGAGGMGAVYLARDPELDRPVAIKLVKDDLSDDPELGERFTREARAAARLRHPNIITIFDIGEDNGRPFIAMEFVPGESVADLVRRQAPLSLAAKLSLVDGLCQGLAHAHRAGIVHRDIKPPNLIVDAEGVLKILDFGIARLADSKVTRDGVLVGSINYMAPEQILGKGADHRSDIFAVGCVFYELLTCRQAFPGTVSDGVFTRICNEAPPPVQDLVPDVPEEVVRILERALEKDPVRRYSDLSLMARDLAVVRGPLAATAEQVGARTDQMTMVGTPVPGSVAWPGTPAVSAPDAPGTSGSGIRRVLSEADERLRQSDLTGVAEALGRMPADPGSDVRQELARIRQELEDARQRREHARESLDRARTLVESGDADGALAASDEAASLDGSLAEAHEIGQRARRLIDERRQQAEAQKAAGARQAAVFVDAAELALSQRDFVKAASLVEDAARIDGSLEGLQELRTQAEAGIGRQREAERRRDERERLLGECHRSLAAGRLREVAERVERILALDPADGDGRGRALKIQLRQAERASSQQASRPAAAMPADYGERRGMSPTVILVILLLLALAAMGSYVYFR